MDSPDVAAKNLTVGPSPCGGALPTYNSDGADILPKNDTVDDYEIEHNFESIGWKTMLLNARKIREKNNDLPIILLAIEDITERKRLEELLTDSEKRYRRLFETASDGIVLLEKCEGRIVHANPASEKMLGYSKEEYIGKKLEDIGVPIDMSDFPELMQSLKRGGILNYNDVEVNTKSGHSINTDIYLVDRASLAQCNIRDVSERKRAENDRETLLRWKEDVNLLQRSLLAPTTQEQKLKGITDAIVRIFNADFCRIWLIRPGDLCEQGCIHAHAQEDPHVCRYRDRCLHLMASSGRYTHTDGKAHRRIPFGCYKIGLIASGEEHKFLTNDVQNDPHVHNHEWARDLGLVSFGGYQLRVPDGQTIGVMALFSKHPISADEDSMLDGLSSTVALVIQQTAAEAALRKSEKDYKELFDSSLDGIYQIDADGVFILMNPAGAKIFGYESPDEIIGRKGLEYWRDPRDRDAFRAELMIKKSLSNYHMRLNKNNGEPIDLETSSTIKEDEKGVLLGMEGILRDVTENKKLEAQLRQAQKMESIGTLAGGIAHDFNNILTAIIGYGYLSLMEMGPDDPQRANIEHMLEGADRAAHLTKDLLIFSRKEVSEKTPVDLNEIVRMVKKFLVRVIGEDIICSMALQSEPIVVYADTHQLEQVLMNLATNARDAMAGCGELMISSEQITLSDDYIAGQGYGKPGRYALMTISDTGKGMDEETLKKIFEPFFTTKEEGKGTGLGLAVVYGIIKQHEGFIDVCSEPGAGTTFKIYLPLISSEVRGEEIELEKETLPRGTETILLVEDDETTRGLISIVLNQEGYTVIEAVDGKDAVKKFMENRETIDLLISDLIMPKINGKEAYDEMKAWRPELKAVFVSGYAPDDVRQKLRLESGIKLISKPMLSKVLLRKVRSVLDNSEV